MWGKKNQRKVECISQILTFLIFRLFLYKVLSFYLFSRLTRHFICLIFMFFIIHNGRLAVIFLFSERQIRIRHIPQCNFLLLKGNDFYFFEKKITINSQLQKCQKYQRTIKQVVPHCSDAEQKKLTIQYFVCSHKRLQGNTNTVDSNCNT